MISAFDFYNLSIDDKKKASELILKSKEDGAIVFLDSGNFESFWTKGSNWHQDQFHEVLVLNLHNIAFSFDIQNINYSTNDEYLKAVNNFYKKDLEKIHSGILVPILHGQKHHLSDLIYEFVEANKLNFIAIPERELGDGILERVNTLQLIKARLENLPFSVKIHLLGADSPYAMLIYTLFGVDSFDGLIWKQTSVDKATGFLHHFHLREIYDGDKKTKYSNYHFETLIENLEFNQQWMNKITELKKENRLLDFMKISLPESFVSRLESIYDS